MRPKGAKRLDVLREKVLASDEGSAPPRADTPAKPRSVLARRQSGVSEQVSGKSRSTRLLKVSPDEVKPWAGHNRDYASLTPERCADLIESIGRSGQQFPAIVRPAGEGGYELVCGARRHWTTRHLGIDLEVEVRKLDDVEAFILQDIENRDREDISDLERALDYRHALGAYFDGSKSKLAESLKMDRGNLTRLLQLAELPNDIIDAYDDRRELLVHHGTIYHRALKVPTVARRLKKEAQALHGKGLKGPQVVSRLKRVISEPDTPSTPTGRSPTRIGDVTYKVNPRNRQCALNFVLPDNADTVALNRLKGDLMAVIESLSTPASSSTSSK